MTLGFIMDRSFPFKQALIEQRLRTAMASRTVTVVRYVSSASHTLGNHRSSSAQAAHQPPAAPLPIGNV